MTLLNRIKFAFRHDFDSDFLVVTLGKNSQAVRFLDFDEAWEFASSQDPQYGQLKVLKSVNRKVKK